MRICFSEQTELNKSYRDDTGSEVRVFVRALKIINNIWPHH